MILARAGESHTHTHTGSQAQGSVRPDEVHEAQACYCEHEPCAISALRDTRASFQAFSPLRDFLWDATQHARGHPARPHALLLLLPPKSQLDPRTGHGCQPCDGRGSCLARRGPKMRYAKMWVSARLSGVRSATLLPAVALSSPSPGKVPKWLRKGSKGH